MQTLPYTATVAQGPKGEADVVMVALFLNELSFPPLRFTRVLCRLPPTILGTSTNWARLESASLRLQLSKEKERHSFIGCASRFFLSLTFILHSVTHSERVCETGTTTSTWLSICKVLGTQSEWQHSTAQVYALILLSMHSFFGALLKRHAKDTCSHARAHQQLEHQHQQSNARRRVGGCAEATKATLYPPPPPPPKTHTHTHIRNQ